MSPIQKGIVFLVAKTLTDETLLADVCVSKHGATWIGTGEMHVRFVYTVIL